jgi:hypothetical protein
MVRIAAVAAALVAAAAAAGCAQETPKPLPEPFSLGPPGIPAPAAPADPHGHSHGTDPALPAGHPPVAPSAADPADAPPPPSGRVGPERFSSPEGWQAEKPAGSMRLLQYRLPRADGDGADGEVLVFGNAMGSTTANIDRWRGQFTSVAQGKDSLTEVTEGVKGKVHLLDVTGKYGGGMAPGGAGHPGAAPEGEARMVAAVVEAPDATFYVKATGPVATVSKWEASIRKFILDAAAK